MDSFRFVYPLARKYARRYLLGLALVPISALSTFAVPWLTGQAVRELQAGSGFERFIHGPTTRPALPWLPDFGLAVDLIVSAIVAGWSLFAIRWFIISASRQVEYDLRNRVFGHLQALDQSYYSSARTGDLMSRITSDVERVRLLVGPIILYASRTGLFLAVGIPLMLSVSPLLTLMVMGPLSLMTISVRYIGPRVHREVFLAQETLSELSSLAQEDFSGIRVVQSFARESSEAERFEDVSKRYFEQNMRAVRVSSWMQPVIGGIGDLAFISLLFVGGSALVTRDIAFADFVAFAGYQVTLIWPMLSIGWVVNQYQRARASVDRIQELMKVDPAVSDPESPATPPEGEIRGAIQIRKLDYELGGRKVLDDISIDVPAGSTAAIIGRTGSGKSTLLQLIPRVLPVPANTISIDGIDI
ncbi:MAG: ABC transporter transmembrane domain-containing protein, partial [Planctomycetota bacterium]